MIDRMHEMNLIRDENFVCTFISQFAVYQQVSELWIVSCGNRFQWNGYQVFQLTLQVNQRKIGTTHLLMKYYG